MAITRMILIAWTQFKESLRSSSFWTLLCTLFVCEYYLNLDAVRLQSATGLALNVYGYVAAVFSNHFHTLVFGLGAVILFAELPLIRGNAVFEAIRCSRTSWLTGRLLYLVMISIIYVASSMLLCAFTSGGSWNDPKQWGKLLNSIANGYSFSDFSIPAELSLRVTGAYMPVGALAVAFCLSVLAVLCTGCIMFALSMLSGRVSMLVAGGFIAIMDFAIYEKLPYWLYQVSPMSLTRLSVVCEPDMPWYPTLQEGVALLLGCISICIVVISITVCSKKRFSALILNEQY